MPLISLPYGNANFNSDDLIEYIKSTGRNYIIQGQIHCTRNKHAKPRSLDCWLRDNYADNPDTTQALDEVIKALIETKDFGKDKFTCPDNGKLCTGIYIRDYFNGFNRLKEFMINDLKNSTVNGHANFLVAMGLFNYIEILGSFCLPHDMNNKEEERFKFVFKELLPETYKKILKEISEKIDKTYSILRCGMTHGYIPTVIFKKKNIKVSYKVIGVSTIDEYNHCIYNHNCAVELEKTKEKEYVIRIYNPRFIYDFEYALNKMSELIQDDKLKNSFIERAKEIDLDFLQ